MHRELSGGSKKRILFVAEAVTLAQVVRLCVLARSLDPDVYEVHFASAEFPELVFAGSRFVRHRVASVSAEAMNRALESGRRLYETATLSRYIAEEVALIEAVRPELVIGDFRLSLSSSAELCGVPSAVLINAYWSPHARRERFPVPDHPIVRWLGESLTEQYFPRALPSVFRHFASPLDAARKKRGLRAIGSLLEVLTHADHVLYPDDPELTPVAGAPESHRFLGPVLWQPEVDAVDARLPPGDAPLVYVTLGSSGNVRLLPMLVGVLGRLPVRAVVATADRARLGAVPSNVLVRGFVRGSDVARRAGLVVSNGGSTTGYQALAEGTPVLGLPSNLDQYLATQAIVEAGAGQCYKARQASPEGSSAALLDALSAAELQLGARRVARRFAAHDACARFRRFVADVIGPAPQSQLLPTLAGLVGEPPLGFTRKSSGP